MATVFITRVIPDIAKTLLEETGHSVRVYAEDRPIPECEFIEGIKEADGVITLLTDTVSKKVIDAMTRCRVIANYAVGYNNIDVAYAASKGIIVTNTPGILTQATAEVAIALLFACARRITEGDAMMRRKEFTGWKPILMLGKELAGSTLGIIGMGRIGQRVAEMASFLGMRIVFYNRTPLPDVMPGRDVRQVALDELMQISDAISVHIPLTEGTRYFIDEQMLSLMKPDAIFINTARGEVVDEKALLRMLQEKKIFSAGFDVYDGEPAVNPELLRLDNAVLLPHVGSGTFTTRSAMAQLAAENVIAVLNGSEALTPVSR